MDAPKSTKVNWGGKLWLLAVIAIVLTILIVAVLIPRPLAYISPPSTAAPWTEAPGLYVIPTITPIPTPTVPPTAAPATPVPPTAVPPTLVPTVAVTTTAAPAVTPTP